MPATPPRPTRTSPSVVHPSPRTRSSQQQSPRRGAREDLTQPSAQPPALSSEPSGQGPAGSVSAPPKSPAVTSAAAEVAEEEKGSIGTTADPATTTDKEEAKPGPAALASENTLSSSELASSLVWHRINMARTAAAESTETPAEDDNNMPVDGDESADPTAAHAQTAAGSTAGVWVFSGGAGVGLRGCVFRAAYFARTAQHHSSFVEGSSLSSVSRRISDMTACIEWSSLACSPSYGKTLTVLAAVPCL